MSSRARLLTAVLAVAAAAVAFAALKPGDDNATTATTGAATTRTTSSAATPTTPSATAPAGPVVRVKGGQPVGGVQDVTVKQGGVIRLTVTSDERQEVHMHGYDVAKEAGPGAPARFVVPATINGVFEVELEQTAVQIAKLTVEP